MAKKKEMVSVSKIDEVVKEQYHGTVFGTLEADWHGLKFEIQFPPSLSDMIQIASEVSDGCFLDDGRFVPEIKEFLLRKAITEHFTNVRLPQNAEKQYELLMCTDFFDQIEEVYDEDQIDAMMEPIDEKIDHIRDLQLSTERAKLNELILQFTSIGENIEKLFGGVTNADLKELVGAISKSGVDEEKLMAQYLDRKYGKDGERPALTVIPKEE